MAATGRLLAPMQKHARQIIPHGEVVDMIYEYTQRYGQKYQEYVGGHTDV